MVLSTEAEEIKKEQDSADVVSVDDKVGEKIIDDETEAGQEENFDEGDIFYFNRVINSIPYILFLSLRPLRYIKLN